MRTTDVLKTDIFPLYHAINILRINKYETGMILHYGVT